MKHRVCPGCGREHFDKQNQCSTCRHKSSKAKLKYIKRNEREVLWTCHKCGYRQNLKMYDVECHYCGKVKS